MGKEQELLDAARSGQSHVVHRILNLITRRSNGPLSSFRRGPNINAQDMNGWTALHHACINGHLEIVRLLLTHGALPDVPDRRGSTALYLAAWVGHGDVMKMLLFHAEKPANPNAQTIDNDTPLHCAAQHGHNVALDILLSFGADPTIRNNNFETALDLAARYGRLQAVQKLIRKHPELIEPYKQRENGYNGNTTHEYDTGRYSPPYEHTTPTKHIFTLTCLHLASGNGHKKVVETLLAAGVDVNILTRRGSALHEAAFGCRMSVVLTLLEAGIDVQATDSDGHTALEKIKDYPTHVDISRAINDFHSVQKQKQKPESPFRPIHVESADQNELIVPEMRDKSHSIPKSAHEHRYLHPTARHAIKPINIQFDSTQSLESSTQIPGQYLKMKPIKLHENGAINTFSQSQSSSDQTLGKDENPPKPGPKPTQRSAKHNSETPKYRCVDGYVKMSKPTPPININSPKPKKPLPIPRHFDAGDYENINKLSLSNVGAKYAKVTPLRAFVIDANNNKDHSPTPECPPPTVTEAEDTIFEYIQPLSAKSKRKSLRLQNLEDLDLEHFVFDGLSMEDSAESQGSRVSDYVEEFVAEEPYAGLFKGSTFTLNTITDTERLEGHPTLEQVPSGLRSPSLVRAVKPIPAKRKLSRTNKFESTEELSVSKVWAEIDTILETIGNEVSNAELFANPTDVESNKEDLKLVQEKETENIIKIRDPNDLVISQTGQSGKNNSDAKWCHSANALIYGDIIYSVYYLGSTVIRVLHGTLSTRKSIQKLKRGETPGFDDDGEGNLLEDCSSSTKIVKANHEQTRLEVGIALSHTGVRFIDPGNESTICTHDIQNINCVCQDNEDLRYFAYITKEDDMHYCHVFMVDDLDLTKEIILTLGQTFEVAYQLALQQRSISPKTDITTDSNSKADLGNF